MPFTQAKNSRKRTTRKRVSRPIGSTLRASQLAASTRRRLPKRPSLREPELVPKSDLMAVEDDPPYPYKLRDLQILTVTHGAEQPKKEAIYLPANIEVVLFTQEGDMLLFNIINKFSMFICIYCTS